MAVGALAAIGAETEARHLVAGVLGLTPTTLHTRADEVLDAAGRRALGEGLERRLAGEPLAYVLGAADFRDLSLRVDGRVLVPRPETETLVDAVTALPLRASDRVLEVGVGSGAVALSLLHEGRFDRILGTDVSEAALGVARANATALGLASRLELRQGETYAPIADGERFALIVSNPPYIADGERAALPREVRDHEPAVALYAGPDGLDVIRALVDGAGDVLSVRGWLAMEIGAAQGGAVRAALEDAGFESVRVLPDLAGRHRIALGQAPRNGGTGRRTPARRPREGDKP
jgi:release factor glutamine methyltransferase